jgi:hypothetical protein
VRQAYPSGGMRRGAPRRHWPSRHGGTGAGCGAGCGQAASCRQCAQSSGVRGRQCRHERGRSRCRLCCTRRQQRPTRTTMIAPRIRASNHRSARVIGASSLRSASRDQRTGGRTRGHGIIPTVWRDYLPVLLILGSQRVALHSVCLTLHLHRVRLLILFIAPWRQRPSLSSLWTTE